MPIAQAVSSVGQNIKKPTPLFKDFAETWFSEKSVEWRTSHRKTIRDDIDKRLVPRFGEMAVSEITKADILAYRADLAKAPARGKTQLLSNPRINKILNPLRQILCEAADRHDFRTPFQNIIQLRVKRTDVDPFSLGEVQKIINTARPDFRNYFTVRFFTGMRTGEVHGLKWKYVDFERRLILVRETVVDGEETYTKTDFSQRDIQMSQVVFDALKACCETGCAGLSVYVAMGPGDDGIKDALTVNPTLVTASAGTRPGAPGLYRASFDVRLRESGWPTAYVDGTVIQLPEPALQAARRQHTTGGIQIHPGREGFDLSARRYYCTTEFGASIPFPASWKIRPERVFVDLR